MYKSALYGKSDPLLHRAWEGLRGNCVSLFFLEAAAPDRHMGCSNSELTIMGGQTDGKRVGTDKEWEETPKSMKVECKKGAKAAVDLPLSTLI